MGLRRLIKRNRKKEEAMSRLKQQSQKDEDQTDKIVKAPFVVASFVQDANSLNQILTNNNLHLQISSQHEIKCYGDSNIISMMKLHELKNR